MYVVCFRSQYSMQAIYPPLRHWFHQCTFLACQCLLRIDSNQYWDICCTFFPGKMADFKIWFSKLECSVALKLINEEWMSMVCVMMTMLDITDYGTINLYSLTSHDMLKVAVFLSLLNIDYVHFWMHNEAECYIQSRCNSLPSLAPTPAHATKFTLRNVNLNA